MIQPDYDLVQRLLKSENWVRDVDALSYREIVSLYNTYDDTIPAAYLARWSLITKNLHMLMRIYFAREVENGTL